MSPVARPHPVRILCALLVLALPTGILHRIGLAAPVAVPIALVLLTVPLWWVLRRPGDAAAEQAAVLRTAIVLLAALGIVAGAHLGEGTAGWILAVAVALATVFGSSPGRPARPSAWLGVSMLVVLAVVIWRPLPLTLGSDGPGHVAAILDAGEANALLPPDSFPGATGEDPRFGILHGFFALLGTWTGATAVDTLRWAALFFCPLWLLAHTALVRRLGFGARGAVLVALLFTLHAGAGRAFGTSASAFPGSIAQTLCAFALAALVTGRRPALAIALLALSTLVHPFGWWATTVVLFSATALLAIGRDTRPDARRWLGWSVATLATGAILLLPKLLTRGASAEGLHASIQEVVLLGGGLFVADPFWIFRWGGVGSVLALPALVLLALVAPGWFGRRENRIGMALAIPVWLISLNPLLAPPAWSAVSYLVVRLGRVVLTTWAWAMLATEGMRLARENRRRAVFGVLLAIAGVWGLVGEAKTTWLHLDQPQVIDAPGTDARIEELTNAVRGLDARWLLTDPRIGYGIRARGGPHLVLVPVAHASPNDRDILDRIARWRELHDPGLDDAELLRRLGEFGDAILLVDARTREIHAGLHPYAYVPSDARAAALDQRLRGLGVEVLASGDRWSVFRLPAGEMAPVGGQGGGFRVESVSLDTIEASPGDRVAMRVVFEATGDANGLPQRAFARLEGDMPPVPAGLDAVSKLWRKFFVDRSGRSQDRFGQWIVPADLVVPPARWPNGRLEQTVQLRIPEWAHAGTYTVQMTVHDWTWHDRLELRDYLRDVDRFSNEPAALLLIED